MNDHCSAIGVENLVEDIAARAVDRHLGACRAIGAGGEVGKVAQVVAVIVEQAVPFVRRVQVTAGGLEIGHGAAACRVQVKAMLAGA